LLRGPGGLPGQASLSCPGVKLARAYARASTINAASARTDEAG
jgi:hypothetical protein